jgi:hypothetical protein
MATPGRNKVTKVLEISNQSKPAFVGNCNLGFRCTASVNRKPFRLKIQGFATHPLIAKN